MLQPLATPFVVTGAAARSPEDAEGMAGVLWIADAIQQIGVAASDIARVVAARLGIPDTLAALSARSLTAAERAGDAQSLMAAGRSVGPFVGGLLIGGGSYRALALFSGIGMAIASLTIAAVAVWRHRHPVPTYAAGR